MAAVVVDTTVLVDAVRGRQAAVDWLERLPEAPSSSEIVRVELLRGLRSAERRITEDLCGAIDWIPVSETIARVAGDLGRRYRRSHQGIAAGDLVVAATAQLLGGEPATHNVKHFPMFPGLRAPY